MLGSFIVIEECPRRPARAGISLLLSRLEEYDKNSFADNYEPINAKRFRLLYK